MEVWMVRAGNNNELAGRVEEKSAIGIGWSDLQDLSKYTMREKIKEKYREAYPDHNFHRVNVNAGQIHSFVNEIGIDDLVLTYNKTTRIILIGKCKSNYRYTIDTFGADYSHIRRIDWLKQVSRDDFSVSARNSMGSTLTVFNLSNHLDEIENILKGEKTSESEERDGVETSIFYEDIKARADELIADKLSRLDPYEFQELVGGVLRAMGYSTRMGPPGRDRGVDIIATPDDLGFETPVIKVQVKHRVSSIGAPEVRNFVATLKDNDKGLYVSTGGYSGEVTNDPHIMSRQITLIDREQFIGLLLKHYEKLEPKYQAIIPLKSVYLPVR